MKRGQPKDYWLDKATKKEGYAISIKLYNESNLLLHLRFNK